MINRIVLMIVSMTFCSAVFAGDENWTYSANTGLFALNVEGDVGQDTRFGPGKTEIDLDFDDITNLLEGALALAFTASKDRWTINAAVFALELQDDVHGLSNITAMPYASEFSFTSTMVDLGLEYQLTDTGWSIYGGARNTAHEVEFELDATNLLIGREIEEDWTDLYVGIAYAVEISKNMVWNTRIDVGGGGSDGSATFNTGVAWMFSPSWATSVYGKYYTVDFENDDAGDPDWYLYDNDEFGLGIGISYIW